MTNQAQFDRQPLCILDNNFLSYEVQPTSVQYLELTSQFLAKLGCHHNLLVAVSAYHNLDEVALLQTRVVCLMLLKDDECVRQILLQKLCRVSALHEAPSNNLPFPIKLYL